MRKLAIYLIPLLLLVLIIGVAGCGSSERGAITSFLRDDHTINALLEHDDIMIATNYVFHTTYLRGDACSLLERSWANLQGVLVTKPPEPLFDFWVQIMVSAESVYSSLDGFCGRGWTYGVIDDWAISIEARESAYSILNEVLAKYDIDPASIYYDW